MRRLPGPASFLIRLSFALTTNLRSLPATNSARAKSLRPSAQVSGSVCRANDKPSGRIHCAIRSRCRRAQSLQPIAV